MKNILLLLSILLLCALPLPAGAQPRDSLVYTVVDQPPEFPGGTKALMAYLRQLRYPEAVKEEALIATLRATFTITDKGKIKDVILTRGAGSSVGKDLVRLIKNMPDWKPAVLGGKPVSYQYSVPMSIHLQE